MTPASVRRGYLRNLIELRTPAHVTLSLLTAFGWDCDEALATLDVDDVTAVLRRFRDGELDNDQLEAWADAIEGREDVAFDPEDAVGRFIFEAANPEITAPLDTNFAARWLNVFAAHRRPSNDTEPDERAIVTESALATDLVEFVVREVRDLLDAGHVGPYEFVEILRGPLPDATEGEHGRIAEQAFERLMASGEVALVRYCWAQPESRQDARGARPRPEDWRTPTDTPYLAIERVDTSAVGD